MSNKKAPDGKKINPFMIIIGALIVWGLVSMFITPDLLKPTTKVSLNEIFTEIEKGEIEKVEVGPDSVKAEKKNGEVLKANKENQVSFYELLEMQGIDPNKISGGIYPESNYDWILVLSNIAFPLLMIGLLWWMFKSAGKSAGGVFSLGKSKAKLFSKEEQGKIGFKDVAASKEIKEELYEIVDFLKEPNKYRKLGARIPKGILLVGPAGVGKTLFARAIAGEANVPFYSVAGSEFIEMIVGVGSARVRDLFKTAKENAPALVFIDEIDAIGRQRGKVAMTSNDEREQTLNQILVEMDGFDQRTDVIIIAATNRPDMLDPALVRPGRFDRHIRIDLPTLEERKDIIKIHMRGKPFDKKVDIEMLAKQTVGFSGADIENMLNEAAILAARRKASSITQKDLVEASTKVKLGPERRLLQTEDERKVVAYHEAGHALVAAKSEDAESVARVSIISRTKTLGHTELNTDENVVNKTKSDLLAMIRTMLGGRASEKLIFNEETVGAVSDIERATDLARKMVTELGMSKLGPIQYINENAGLWDVRAQEKSVGYSEKVAEEIDEEVRRIINTEFKNATKILKENKKTLDELANELLKKETLEQDEFMKIIAKYEQKSSKKKS